MDQHYRWFRRKTWLTGDLSWYAHWHLFYRQRLGRKLSCCFSLILTAMPFYCQAIHLKTWYRVRERSCQNATVKCCFLGAALWGWGCIVLQWPVGKHLWQKWLHKKAHLFIQNIFLIISSILVSKPLNVSL